MAFKALSSNIIATGGVASLSITGIPSTYSALRIVFECQPEAAGALEDCKLEIGFNGLSSYNSTSNAWTSYRNQFDGYQNGGGSALLSYKKSDTGTVNYGTVALSWGSNYTSSYKTNGWIDIFEYANTNNNTIVNGYYGQALNGSAYYANGGMMGNCWDTAAAVSSIQLKFSNGDIAAQGTFDLYGVD
jgi:hypothetical protein